MPDERRVLLAYVDGVCSDIAKKVARDLQRTKTTLSGQDSGLRNVWEELCVQQQAEESIFWNAYDDTVRRRVVSRVGALSPSLQTLVWFTLDTHGAEDSSEYDEEQLVEHIVGVVYDLAESYSNKRIAKHLARQLD